MTSILDVWEYYKLLEYEKQSVRKKSHLEKTTDTNVPYVNVTYYFTIVENLFRGFMYILFTYP